MDTAAAAILEMLQSNERVLSLTAPRPATWMDVFQPVAEILGVPLVSASKWLEKLRESARRAEDGKGHESAHNLIGFFKSEGMGGAAVPLSTAKAVKASKALANARPLGSEDAVRYVEFWAKVGHLAL